MNASLEGHPIVGPPLAFKRFQVVLGVMMLAALVAIGIIATVNGQPFLIAPLLVFAVASQAILYRSASRAIVIGPEGLTVNLWPTSRFIPWAEIQRVRRAVRRGKGVQIGSPPALLEIVDGQGGTAVFSAGDDGHPALARALMDHAGVKIDEAVLETVMAWASSDAPRPAVTSA